MAGETNVPASYRPTKHRWISPTFERLDSGSNRTVARSGTIDVPPQRAEGHPGLGTNATPFVAERENSLGGIGETASVPEDRPVPGDGPALPGAASYRILGHRRSTDRMRRNATEPDFMEKIFIFFANVRLPMSPGIAAVSAVLMHFKGSGAAQSAR